MDVAGIGMPFFDQILSIEALPETDKNARTLESSWQYGGKIPTALAAISRLGYTAAIHTNVGGIFGRCIRLDFERHNIDCSHLTDIPGTQSPVILCLAEKTTGGRSFLGFRHPSGVPPLQPKDLDKEALLQAKWLLLADIDDTTVQAAKWFCEAGKPVVVDVDNLKDGKVEQLQYMGHCLASEYAYKSVFGEDVQYEKNLRELRAWQKNEHAVTVVTLGARGLVGIDSEGIFFQSPANKVDVIDTTGAGDVFHGAYIAGCLEGFDTVAACKYAQAASAVKCTRLGGRAGIPTKAQLQAFMETGQLTFPELDERVAYYREPPFDRLLAAMK